MYGEKKDEKGKFEKGTLGWFFRETFPVSKRFYENNPQQKKVKACFITTAHFDKDAQTKLDSIQKGNLKSEYINVAYDGKQLKEKLKELNLNREVQILEQFYFNR